MSDQTRNSDNTRDATESLCCMACCGMDLTLWDLARMGPCMVWSSLAFISSMMFLEAPISQSRTPHLLPMFGALQSCLPSFMCAVLICLYHRQRIHTMGMSRETVNAVRGLYSMASAIGLGINLTILVVTVFVFHLDRTDEPTYFFLSFMWFLVSLLWFILQGCLSPSSKQIEQMVALHELTQLRSRISGPPGVALVIGVPVTGDHHQDGECPETELTSASAEKPIVLGQQQ